MPRKITTIRLPQDILDQFFAGVARGGRSQMIRATVAVYCRLGLVPEKPAGPPRMNGDATSAQTSGQDAALQSKSSAPITITLPSSEYRRWERYSKASGVSVSKLVAHALVGRFGARQEPHGTQADPGDASRNEPKTTGDHEGPLINSRGCSSQ